MQPLLDSESVGAYLGVDVRTVRAFVSRGALQAVRLPTSRALRFKPEVIARFVADAETQTKTEAQ